MSDLMVWEIVLGAAFLLIAVIYYLQQQKLPEEEGLEPLYKIRCNAERDGSSSLLPYAISAYYSLFNTFWPNGHIYIYKDFVVVRFTGWVQIYRRKSSSFTLYSGAGVAKLLLDSSLTSNFVSLFGLSGDVSEITDALKAAGYEISAEKASS